MPPLNANAISFQEATTKLVYQYQIDELLKLEEQNTI